ncbi:MAG: DMT family transporter [Alphaproteobacteria bacterium]|nr:DMT family transporter [Alphaproteobacteria bacterium]
MATAAENRRGIFAMMAAMAFWCANDTLVKLATQTWPASQVMTVRSVFAGIAALGFVAAHGGLRQVRHLSNTKVIARAAMDACVAAAFITALAHMPLATITVIGQSTPIVMTLLAVLLGLERVGWRRWAAIVVGFLGVLVVIRPGSAPVDIYVALALFCALMVCVRDLMTGRIGADVPTVVITLSSTFTVGAFGIAAGIVGSFAGTDWQPLAWREVLCLAGAGALVTVGNNANVLAFRNTDVAVVMPFRYSVILWAIILGYFVFGDLPDPTALLGAALIAASGVYTLHRERKRAAMDAARRAR